LTKKWQGAIKKVNRNRGDYFMSSNKEVKEELIKYYGAECFIEKLHLRKDDTPRKYTSKGQMEKMKQLTYHHIKMKKDGGKATRENGALLSSENHQWFHQQSSTAQGYMNALFQEYKRQVDECRIIFVDELDIPYKINVTEFSVDEKEKYNRAKEKKETQELIDEYYDK
jgi:hypothetical protein